MEKSSQYFVFFLEDQRYALALDTIVRVIRAVELTRLPNAPDSLVGLLNLGGEILPVLNLRNRFSLARHDLDIDDRIVICKAGERNVAFIADTVVGVVELAPGEIDEAARIFPEMAQYVEGVGKMGDHTVLIYDLGRLFPMEDIERLELDMK